MTRRYARALKGDRAYSDAPYQRGNNLTLIGAMRAGTRWRNDLPGATDALAFKTYVSQVLVPIWSGACVVMDNLPAHKVAGIREAIEAVEQQSTCLLYSPDFPRLKTVGQKISEFLRARAARTYVQLDQAITDALAAVTKDIIGWFTHCCYYVSPN